MILHYRLGRWAYTHPWRKLNPIWYLYLLLKVILRTITKIELPPSAQIGHDLYLPHPYGLVMAGNTIVGDGCTIGPWVVIGHLRKDGNPRIGDGVYIGPGACVLGSVTVGDQVVIGAHALVVESIPNKAKVLGAKGVVKLDEPTI